MSASPRVAIIAFDAMDSGIALDLAAGGSMPNLGALLERSWSRPVANPKGLLVGGVWPTYWSGNGPGTHGFYCFRQVVNGTYEIERRTPADIAIPPLWRVVSDAGRRCAVIDAPMSALDRHINGVQTVEWGAHDRIVPFGTVPDQLHDMVLSEFGAHPVPRCDAFIRDGDPVGLRRALLAGIDVKQRLAAHFLRDGPWDLFIVGHSETHCAGHQFWSVHDPSHPRHDPDIRECLGDPIVDVYRAADTALGRHLAALEGEGVVFVVLSHGMGPHYDGDHLLHEVLVRLDSAMSPRSRGREVLEHGARYLGRRRRRREDRVALDGSRRFYRIPNNELYGGIRINLAGREPRGLVAPGRELDELIEELRREFLALIDPDTGRPIVRALLRTSELHPGPAVNDLPDLVVDWVRAAPINGASSPRIGTVRAAYDGIRTGDHRPRGLLAACGPGIEPSVGRPVRSVDFAPTVAALLDVEAPGMEGEPITELLSAHR